MAELASLDSFCAYVERELDLEDVRPDRLLVADLGLDSIGLSELLLLLDDLGCRLAELDHPETATVEMVYRRYAADLARPAQ